MLRKNTGITPNRLRDYCSLFTSGVASKLLKGDLTAIDHKIDRYDSNWRNRKNATYQHYLRYAYGVIESHYRNEYVYKNSFLNQWLIRELGHDDTKVFNEFRVREAIADLATFNGKSRAFEIKTALDSDVRLPDQLVQYRKIFNEIYLIIPEQKVGTYRAYSEAGLITYCTQHNKFSLERKAEYRNYVCIETVMHTLRSEEYKAAVKDYYGELPKMTSFTQFDKCKRLLHEVPNERMNELFIEIIKKRHSSSAFSSKQHRELNQLALAMNLTSDNKQRLINNLAKNISY